PLSAPRRRDCLPAPCRRDCLLRRVGAIVFRALWARLPSAPRGRDCLPRRVGAPPTNIKTTF
ncbi:MAG: hypothetical protein RSD68_07010, partial [Oscillospiraceae bacterium]